MSSGLNQRILTAAVLIPLVVAAIFTLSTLNFALLLVMVLAVAAWEWGRLVHFSVVHWLLFAASLLAVLGLFLAGAISPAMTHAVSAVAVLWWMVAAAWVMRYRPNAGTATSWRGLLVGWLVLAPAFLCLVALHWESRYGPGYVLFLLVVIWAADSGAYFAGRRFGRHKLAPLVSPGKSWEGVAGGMLAAALVALAGGRMLGIAVETLPWLVMLSMTVVAFSIVGDLLESLFKRNAGVKDSSHLLPGHGGALDRIDSLTAAAPAFYMGLSLMDWSA